MAGVFVTPPVSRPSSLPVTESSLPLENSRGRRRLASCVALEQRAHGRASAYAGEAAVLDRVGSECSSNAGWQPANWSAASLMAATV